MFSFTRDRHAEEQAVPEFTFEVGRKAHTDLNHHKDYYLYCQEQDAIRHVGYTSLKPPGITKTMQALVDEASERTRDHMVTNHGFSTMNSGSLD